MLLRHVQSVRRYAAFRPPAVAELATLRKNEVKAVAEQARGLVEIYREALEHSPVRANALTSGVLCAFGDVLAQTVERRMSSDSNASQGRFDRWRTARMAVYGTFICGPLLSGWYVTLHHLGEAISVTYRPIVGGWLGRLTPFGHLHKEASGTLSPLQLLLAKVTADGLLFQAPFLNLYFVTMGALEGLSPSAIFDKVTKPRPSTSPCPILSRHTSASPRPTPALVSHPMSLPHSASKSFTARGHSPL